jgi:hypothetical protein
MLISRRCTPIHADGGWSRDQTNAAVGCGRVFDWWVESASSFVWNGRRDSKKVGKLVTGEPGFAGVAFLATCLVAAR